MESLIQLNGYMKQMSQEALQNSFYKHLEIWSCKFAKTHFFWKCQNYWLNNFSEYMVLLEYEDSYLSSEMFVKNWCPYLTVGPTVIISQK